MKRSADRWLLAAIVAVAGLSSVPESAAQAVGATPNAQVGVSQVEAVEAAGLGKMWTFDRLPLDYLKERYDFQPSPAWFDHVRLASLRTGGCSASFVSPDGLVMTNHHCARGCIAAVSDEEHDYIEQGFYATSRDLEPSCPGMFLDQLLEIEDVTDQIRAAVPAGVADEEAIRLKGEVADSIEEACSATGELRCQVVPLYHGGIYSLYKYRRYDDVRLVFAPEGQAAFFGGDPDNFTYPRHDLDVSFLRAYEEGEPVQARDYFKWSAAGAAEEELVFVTGNPGSTGRLLTVAQLEYLRDAAYPTILEQLNDRLVITRALAAEDEALARRYRNAIFGIQNSIKAIGGYLGGLKDPKLMAKKQVWERGFRAAVAADSELDKKYGSAWDEIAAVNKKLTEIDASIRYSSFANFRTLAIARDIVRLNAQMVMPEGARTWSQQQMAAARRRIESSRPIDARFEEMLLASRLAAAQATLGADNPFVKAALGGRDPTDAAHALIAGSSLGDVSARKALLEGGSKAIDASSDPAIVFARAIDSWARKLEDEVNELRAIESTNEERVAEALFEIYGTVLPPDATFTLRLSDGIVRRYPLNGTYAPYKTTFYGLFDRAEAFDYKSPWNIAPRWMARRDLVDLSTPLDFVSTADIIGGNSGSPVINRDAEVVGLIFDGNMEMLPNRFLYSDDVARAVAVHSMALIEALRNIYDAGALADELQGGH